MKKFLCLFLVLFLLTGCTAMQSIPGDPTEPSTQVPTEPPLPWVEEVGIPWDAEGALLEVPITIPDGLHYSSAVEFDGDLLLWSFDNHLEDTFVLELCLLELDDGTVAATRDIALEEYVYPQILKDKIYLCDSLSGKILRLNKDLRIEKSWDTQPTEGSWYMGGREILYIYDWSTSAFMRDLTTGEETPLLDGAELGFLSVRGTTAVAEYYRPDSGAAATALIDILTGKVLAESDERLLSMDQRQNVVLYGIYQDSNIFQIGTQDNMQMADLGEDMLAFQDDKTLLRTAGDGTFLSLHQLDGKALARCQITANPYRLSCSTVIYNETLGGYFCLVSEYEASQRLLFWDTDRGDTGDDISFIPVPEPSEEQALLNARAAALSEEYGVSILVGENCDTWFTDFTAEQATDYFAVSGALDTLEAALSSYPESFFYQLRYDTVHTLEIQLVTNLTALDTDYFPGEYAGFAQDLYDRHLVVVDIENSAEETYYHEFSHIIDTYLEWDAWQRQDALFSEETWASLNPSWFTGYSLDYGQEHYLEDFESFIDTYSTVSPTEDRARILEYAMMDFNSFEGCPVLEAKLAYYSRCIRDAFDTTGWPETLQWEQYLT